MTDVRQEFDIVLFLACGSVKKPLLFESYHFVPDNSLKTDGSRDWL